MKIKRFNEIITEDAATSASPGSGTAVGSGDSGGSFTSAMGVSVSGGDTGTSFSTGSNTSGMGAVKSAQPSDTPGDVAGSTKGSGDIGANLGGVYTKANPKSKNKKKEKKINDGVNAVENTVIRSFSDMYVGNYSNESVNENGLTNYSYVGVRSNDIEQIYIVPSSQTDAYNIGYIDDDNKFVLYSKFKFSKESLNDLEAREIPSKIKMDIEDTITDVDLKTIENYIKA